MVVEREESTAAGHTYMVSQSPNPNQTHQRRTDEKRPEGEVGRGWTCCRNVKRSTTPVLENSSATPTTVSNGPCCWETRSTVKAVGVGMCLGWGCSVCSIVGELVYTGKAGVSRSRGREGRQKQQSGAG